jgi:hypothetical protein
MSESDRLIRGKRPLYTYSRSDQAVISDVNKQSMPLFNPDEGTKSNHQQLLQQANTLLTAIEDKVYGASVSTTNETVWQIRKHFNTHFFMPLVLKTTLGGYHGSTLVSKPIIEYKKAERKLAEDEFWHSVGISQKTFHEMVEADGSNIYTINSSDDELDALHIENDMRAFERECANDYRNTAQAQVRKNVARRGRRRTRLDLNNNFIVVNEKANKKRNVNNKRRRCINL